MWSSSVAGEIQRHSSSSQTLINQLCVSGAGKARSVSATLYQRGRELYSWTIWHLCGMRVQRGTEYHVRQFKLDCRRTIRGLCKAQNCTHRGEGELCHADDHSPVRVLLLCHGIRYAVLGEYLAARASRSERLKWHNTRHLFLGHLLAQSEQDRRLLVFRCKLEFGGRPVGLLSVKHAQSSCKNA